jgi:hypothetical protein
MHLQLRLLALSLLIAVALALGLVKAILWLGFKEQLSYVIPLLPIFYAIIYPSLERQDWRRWTPSASTPSHHLYVDAKPRRWSGKLPVILAGVAAALTIHGALETAAWLGSGRAGFDRAHWFTSGASLFFDLLRGQAVPISGLRHAAFLGMDMALMSLVGGVCVGLMSPATPLLNGLMAGVIVSVWLGANQFSVLYGPLMIFSSQVTETFKIGWKWYYGLSTGLFLQAFSFAVCGELAARLRAKPR